MKIDLCLVGTDERGLTLRKLIATFHIGLRLYSVQKKLHPLLREVFII